MLFLAKVTITPVLMWIVSLVSRKWGSAVGGLLAGLPVTSAPVSIYLMLEQGPAFAAQAAMSSLTGTGAVAASYLVYALAGRRSSMPVSAALALTAFAGTAGILLAVRPGPLLILAFDIILITVGLLCCRTPVVDTPAVEKAAPDLPAKIAASTAMVLAITLTARWTGPVLSGFLTPIPVIAWPLIVFVHHRQGRWEAIASIRGILQGAYGLVTFSIVTGLMLPHFDPALTYSAGLAGSILTAIPWLLPMRSTARRVPFGTRPKGSSVV